MFSGGEFVEHLLHDSRRRHRSLGKPDRTQQHHYSVYDSCCHGVCNTICWRSSGYADTSSGRQPHNAESDSYAPAHYCGNSCKSLQARYGPEDSQGAVQSRFSGSHIAGYNLFHTTSCYYRRPIRQIGSVHFCPDRSCYVRRCDIGEDDASALKGSAYPCYRNRNAKRCPGHCDSKQSVCIQQRPDCDTRHYLCSYDEHNPAFVCRRYQTYFQSQGNRLKSFICLIRSAPAEVHGAAPQSKINCKPKAEKVPDNFYAEAQRLYDDSLK